MFEIGQVWYNPRNNESYTVVKIHETKPEYKQENKLIQNVEFNRKFNVRIISKFHENETYLKTRDTWHFEVNETTKSAKICKSNPEFILKFVSSIENFQPVTHQKPAPAQVVQQPVQQSVQQSVPQQTNPQKQITGTLINNKLDAILSLLGQTPAKESTPEEKLNQIEAMISEIKAINSKMELIKKEMEAFKSLVNSKMTVYDTLLQNKKPTLLNE